MKRFASWLPGVVLVGERHCANALADKVDWEGHREESLHRARMEVQLLKSDGETDCLDFFPLRQRRKVFKEL